MLSTLSDLLIQGEGQRVPAERLQNLGSKELRGGAESSCFWRRYDEGFKLEVSVGSQKASVWMNS
jgi:hypothetical protein